MALPSEHGGWALLLEPALAGLVAAPSAAGLWLALAALGAFLTRHPLQLALADRRRGRRYPRTALAERFALGYALAAALGGAMALASAAHTFWPALLAALIPAAVQLIYDLRRRGRELQAELAGALALCCLAPAILLAGGGTAASAVAIGALLAARALPAILYIRLRLRMARGGREAGGREAGRSTLRPYAAGGAVGAGGHGGRAGVWAGHLAALLLGAGLAAAGVTTWWPAIAFVVLLARAALGLRPAARSVPALWVGLQELALGIVCAALFGAALR